MTEYNTPSLLCILSMSVFFLMHLVHVNKALRLKIQSNQKLQEKLIGQRNYFTEVLVHDLKVPTIAQLRGLELLKNEAVGPVTSAQNDMINQIEQSCQYTLDMISMVLATYKLELEEYNLYYEHTKIPELLLESFVELSHFAQERNVTFTYMATQDEAEAEVDRAEIKKVIINLLASAVAHSRSGEKILVNITTKENNLKFSVITHGKALSRDECTAMFSDYYLNNPKYTAVGHDIGLYLAKKIIEAHNGRIYASTDGVLTNTFTFIIPQSQKEAAIEQACPVLV